MKSIVKKYSIQNLNFEKKIREREKNVCVVWGLCLNLKKKFNQFFLLKLISFVFNIYLGDNSMLILWKKIIVFKFLKNCLKVI